ncbi:MAG: IclR family transcriptional regulator [Alphaproteobacteria bacterium]|nr:IclR family transcriptional regulator [Alphaproteobacteria bacterium]
MIDRSRSVRGIELLFHIAQAEGPITANELSELSGLPKATVYRLCDQLREANYIRRQAGGRGYVSGPRLLALSTAVLAGRSQYAVRHAVLESLAEKIGEACNFAVPDGTAMVYWDRVDTRWPLRLQLPVGTRVPLHCTANGKLYLSSLEPAQRRRLIDELPLEQHTPNTITDPARLEGALEEISEIGYGTDDEEFIEGMVAVAVPVANPSGNMFAGLAFHAPTMRMDIEAAKRYVPLLKSAASKLRTDLNSRNDRRTDDALASSPRIG